MFFNDFVGSDPAKFDFCPAYRQNPRDKRGIMGSDPIRKAPFTNWPFRLIEERDIRKFRYVLCIVDTERSNRSDYPGENGLWLRLDREPRMLEDTVEVVSFEFLLPRAGRCSVPVDVFLRTSELRDRRLPYFIVPMAPQEAIDAK